MRKSYHIVLSTRQLLLAVVIFVSAAAIITGTALNTVTTTMTTTTTTTNSASAASEEDKEGEKSKPKTTTKEKSISANANEKSLTTPSGLPLPTQSSTTTTSDSSVITPPLESKTTNTKNNNNKEITTQSLSSVKALQTNSVPGTRSYYDIIFKTGTTGTIAKVDIAFPAGVDISQRVTVEASGIGSGSTTFGGNTITYNVNSPVSVGSGKTIRLEFGNIIVGLTGSFTVSVTTKRSDGSIIEGPATSSAVVNTQISGNAIADHAVTGSKIAGTSKLVFGQCTVSTSSVVGAGGALQSNCNIPSAQLGDAVVATLNGGSTCFVLGVAAVTKDGVVAFSISNICSFSSAFGTQPVSVQVFKPT